MEKEVFYELVQYPEKLNHETLEGLKKLTEDFPHFHAAWMLYLRNLKDLDHPEFDATLKQAAPLLPDRKQLFRYLHTKQKPAGLEPPSKKVKGPPQEYRLENPGSQPFGDSLIDKFLSASSGTLKLNKLPADEQSAVPVNEIIDRSVTESEELVTETLANIYVEQKKYDKALKAFRKLSLKYPEKNSYFATRIEEIEKLKNI